MAGKIITIDGPGGAGKTTVSRMLARRLGYTYVDTGSLYRGIALVALFSDCVENEERLKELLKKVSLDFQPGEEGARLFLDGKDVSEDIRTPEISMLASRLSAKPIVREALLEFQRKMAETGRAVFEGRDMGTVVFPCADRKFYLDAAHEVRARRRHEELKARGLSTTFEAVSFEMLNRDVQDSTRLLAPLKPAADAVIMDSSNMTAAEVVERMLGYMDDGT
ncbi:MAG: (d)CMP kinase [Pseudomonadota bacterium]